MKKLPLYLMAGLTALHLSPAPAALVAHWPLDADANDATGNGHDGVLDGGGTVTFGTPGARPATGAGATFAGGGHIDIPWSEALNPGVQAPDGSGSFTVALWARPTEVTGNYRSPFTSREDNGPTVNGPIIYIQPNGTWEYWAGNNGASGQWNVLSAGPAVLDEWVHVAIVYDSDTITRKMYLDGVEVINANIGVSANAVRDTHIGGGADDGNSFPWVGDIDDVGFWDHALTEEEILNVMTNGVNSGPVVPDPRLRVLSPITLPFNGAVQEFDIAVANVGESQPLTITGVTFAGTNGASFSTVSIPPTMAPEATGTVRIGFNPQGAVGDVEAVMQIASNDPADPVRSVVIRGTIYDPQAVAPAVLDFGTLPDGSGPVSATLALQNVGGTQTLEVMEVWLLGPLAEQFTVTAFPATVPPGGSGNITVSFDPQGGDGEFFAQLEITTNDPIKPLIVVPVRALVALTNPLLAWWPLDDDANDASGNGFDGFVFEPVIFGDEGANAATGSSAYFESAGHISVPFDPRLNPGVQAPNGSGSFSVTLWAYPTVIGGGHRSPFTSREDNGVTVNGPIIYSAPINEATASQWQYWAGNNGGTGQWNSIDGGGVVAAETWVHVAITYDAATTTRRMFLDGVQVVSQVQGVSPNAVRDIHIGSGQDDGLNFYWEGRIDDVGLFRIALTEAQVQQVMTGGVGSLTGPPPAPGPFAVTAVTGGPATGQFTLTWSSTSGANYRVQRSTTMLTWADLGQVIPGAGTSTSFTDTSLPPPAEAPQGVYYRVRLVP